MPGSVQNAVTDKLSVALTGI